MSECPLAGNSDIGVGCCYKCGSSEHITKTCNTKSNNIKIFPGKFKIFLAHCNNYLFAFYIYTHIIVCSPHYVLPFPAILVIFNVHIHVPTTTCLNLV